MGRLRDVGLDACGRVVAAGSLKKPPFRQQWQFQPHTSEYRANRRSEFIAQSQAPGQFRRLRTHCGL